MISVLLIEDTVFWINEILGSLDKNIFNITHAGTIKDAREALSNTFEIVILDLHLPDSHRFSDTLDSILPLVPYTPVVVITSMALDDEVINKMFSMDVQDVIAKDDFTQELLVHSVMNIISRYKSGKKILEEIYNRLCDTEKILLEIQ